VHPMNLIQERRSWDDSILEPILEKTFDYSLGGYYHREHCRAPDDNRKHRLWIGTVINFIVDKINSKVVLLPSGEICDLLKKQLDNF
jgi:hypothetical protein